MNNPPAFPTTDVSNDARLTGGLTLRDYFAGQALSTMQIPDAGEYPESDKDKDMKQLAQWQAEAAYLTADAMLAEREKGAK